MLLAAKTLPPCRAAVLLLRPLFAEESDLDKLCIQLASTFRFQLLSKLMAARRESASDSNFAFFITPK